MRVLAAWDDRTEADLLALYLGVEENQTAFAFTREDVLAQLRQRDWDVLLLSLTFPGDAAEGFRTFTEVQQEAPDLPVVLACRPTEMVSLTRFLTHGLRFYLIRDGQGDFVFLLLSSLESAMAARRAEEARKLAARLREEMEGVRKLQESIIPHGLTAPPGYRFAARYEPSQVSVVGDQPVVMAGGDYYDLFRPDERTLIVLIGDASGHGLKACMAIMAMHTLIRMMTGDHFRDTAAFVGEINQRLCENSIVQSGGGFITLFYAALDTVAHTMNWTSAGHPLALLHRFATNEVVTVGSDSDTGLPLGIVPDVAYSANTLELPPASQVLLYSDGLTDAFPLDRPGHAQFGVRGIVETLRTCERAEPENTVAQLFRASMEHAGGQGRHDDTSLVLLERLAMDETGLP